jgi:hypothetical protein
MKTWAIHQGGLEFSYVVADSMDGAAEKAGKGMRDVYPSDKPSWYAQLTPEDLRKIRANEVYDTFPSGRFFQGFLNKDVQVSGGRVRCEVKDSCFDGCTKSFSFIPA